MKGSTLVAFGHAGSALVYLLMATSVVFTAPQARWPVFVSWPEESNGNVFFSTQTRVGSWNLGAGATVLALLAALYQGPVHSIWASADLVRDQWYFGISWLVHALIQAQVMVMGGAGDLMVWIVQAGLVGAEHLARYLVERERDAALRGWWWRWSLVPLVWRWATTAPYFFRAMAYYAPELPEYAWTAWILSLVWDVSLHAVTASAFLCRKRCRRDPDQRRTLYDFHLSLLVQTHALSTVLGAWART